MYDIIIIGAGTSGMTAAIYAKRANKNVVIFEANSYGGQIINANKIDNYPALPNISGFDYATNLYNQIKALGVEVKYETVLKINEDKSVVTNKDTYKAKSIIIATGSKNRKLSIPNEDKLIGKGISYCATCDGNFFKGKSVAVVGGGDTALTDAIYLADICNKVYLIHRRSDFSGSITLQDELKNHSNIEILFNTTVSKLNGEERLDSIEINSDDEIKTLDIDCLFIAVGQEPKNQMFSNVVDLDKNGYIITHDDVLTKTKGIYAVGDARSKLLRQLVTAAADGAIAATLAIKEMD